MSDKTVYSRRNPAIDMLRALTMFTMIFVNDFWKVHDVPHWLEHAVYGEDFMGLADIVFPCFLFAVGMSIPYAIERRYAKGFSAESTLGHILSRTFALLVMGAFITNSEFRLLPEAPYPIGVYWFLMATGFIGVWNQYPKPASGTQKNLFRAFKIIGVLVLLYRRSERYPRRRSFHRSEAAARLCPHDGIRSPHPDSGRGNQQHRYQHGNPRAGGH